MSDNPLFDGQGLEFHHLQRLDQQKQAAATRRLLEEQERQRRGVCPCPHCGGGIPKVGVSVCMHCRRELHWNGASCGATKAQAQQIATAAAQQVASEKRLRASKDIRKKQAADWEFSAEGRKNRLNAMGGCLGVLLGVGAVVIGAALAVDAVIDPIGSWSFAMLMCGVTGAGVLLVRIAWSLIRSFKQNPFI